MPELVDRVAARDGLQLQLIKYVSEITGHSEWAIYRACPLAGSPKNPTTWNTARCTTADVTSSTAAWLRSSTRSGTKRFVRIAIASASPTTEN